MWMFNICYSSYRAEKFLELSLVYITKYHVKSYGELDN